MAHAGGLDGFAARLSPTLGHIWSTGFGSAAGDTVNAVIERGDGSVLVAGHSGGSFTFGQSQVAHQGGVDAMVLSLTSGGVPEAGVAFGGAGTDAFVAIATNANNEIVAAGRSAGALTIGADVHAGAGGDDVLVVKLDPSFAPLWSRLRGGPDHQHAEDVAVDALDRVVVGGHFRETLSFGTPLFSAGNTDAFLVQLSP